MRSKKLFLGLAAVLAVFVIATLMTATLAAAQTEKVLHSFSSGKDGSAPWAGLTFDTSGNPFGTTTAGGLNSVGTAFRFTPKVGGGYTEKLLHNFNNNGTDGYTPLAGLIVDSSGNLYGTTSAGGTHAGGTVFELVPQSGGGYAERVLYSFLKNGTDGNTPIGGLIIDSGGNLYGTTQNGGSGNHGTGFELSPSTGRTWTQTIPWNFACTNGANPRGGAVVDSAGQVLGRTGNVGRVEITSVVA